MKKKGKSKYLKLFIGAIIALVCGTQNVMAATLNMDFTGYWYERSDNGNNYSSWKLQNYYVDGNVAFCIEPGVPEGTNQYREVSWEQLGLSNSVKQKVLLYSYYGYQYSGHQTQEYRAATQALIWESILGGNTRVTYNTQRYGAGTPYNVDYEKSVIQDLANHHYDKPSFNGTTVTTQVGKSVTLTDNNNVLSKYEVYASNGAEISINGNQLTITPTKIGSVSLQFVKKQIYSRSYLIYYADDYQNMISGGNIDPVYFSVNVQGLGGQVEINKVDSKTQQNIPAGDASLEGAVYGIYDTSDNLIQTITTDKNGYAKSNYLPYFGRFYLKEISPSKGYLLNEDKISFDSSKDELLTYVKTPEDVITRDYEITKVYASDKTQIMTPEVGVEFGIYNRNNILVKKLTTDNEGKIYFKLPYGRYTLKQLSSTSGHEFIKDFEFEIKDLGPTVNKVFSNAKITSRIKVVKVDQDGNNITKAGIKFKIKDLTTGEYVCQTISYPTTQKICEFETDDNGILITPYPLGTGSYQLEEVDQILEGYVWNSTPLKFTIDEKSDIFSTDEFDAIIELHFTNQEVKGKIEINKVGEKLVIEDDTYTYEEISLPDVVFGLYDESGKLIATVKTDQNGYAKFENLKLGKYTLKELSSSNNNIIDDTEFSIELKYKDQYTPIITKTFSLKNYLPKATLEFSKTDLTSGKELPDVKVQIFTEDDKLIFEGVTNENGKITITDLFVGKFYIVETDCLEGYKISDEKVFFEIKENKEIVKASMTNEKFKGDLDFTKVDLSTGQPLPNVLIEVRNAETDELVFSGRTDENGKIVIKGLEYGKYYILEKETSDPTYILNDEKMFFEITEDGQVIKATMTNEKMPKTFNTDLISMFIVGGTALSGISLLLYAKKRKNK